MSLLTEPIKTNQVPALLEMRTAALVERCRQIVRTRLASFLAGKDAAELADQLWQGVIQPGQLGASLLPDTEKQQLQAGLAAELGGRVAAVLRQPVKLDINVPAADAMTGMMLQEELASGKETYFLTCLLNKACKEVWKQAGGNCPWPVKELKPGKTIGNFFGLAPEEEQQDCLQQLTRMIAGSKVALLKRMEQDISFQVSRQIWSLYDVQCRKATSNNSRNKINRNTLLNLTNDNIA